MSLGGISFDNVRVGRLYRLVNFEEVFEFEVMKRLSDRNYELKDIHTLENYQLEDLVRYGRGKDFDLREM